MTMQWNVSFEPALSCMVVQVSGTPTLAGVVSYVREIFAHPDWQDGMNTLIDYSEVVASTVKTEFVRRIADIPQHWIEKLGGGRCAMVVASKAGFGMARMWEMMTKENVAFEIKIFDSISEAREWLAS